MESKKSIIFQVKENSTIIKAQDVTLNEIMKAHGLFVMARIDDLKIDFMSFSEKVINEF